MIVILSEAEKQQVEADVRNSLQRDEMLGSHIIIRHGNLLHGRSLRRVNAASARAVIVLSGSTDPDAADSKVLRVVMTMVSTIRVHEALTGEAALVSHVVAECRDIDNAPLINMVGGTRSEIIVSHDIVGRLMLTSGRNPGLARVYTSVFRFAGDEFYAKHWPSLRGVRFGDLALRFADAVPVGIEDGDGCMELMPDIRRRVGHMDKIVVLAEDDDTYEPSDEALHPTLLSGIEDEGHREWMEENIAVSKEVSRGKRLSTFSSAVGVETFVMSSSFLMTRYPQDRRYIFSAGCPWV